MAFDFYFPLVCYLATVNFCMILIDAVQRLRPSSKLKKKQNTNGNSSNICNSNICNSNIYGSNTRNMPKCANVDAGLTLDYNTAS